ncbi:MAG: hypothetical protein WCQ21_35895 [Verrucomicrobiota bacterium]|jgi:hypothetical protein
MPKVKIASVREGMVVTADVKNMDTMLLIPAGCVLTEKHINILNAWGIAEVQVESGGTAEVSGDILEQLPAETLAQVRKDLTAIFWDPIDKGAVQAETFDLVLRRKARQVVGQTANPHESEY